MALIKTTEELVEYIPAVTDSFEFTTISPLIDLIEIDLLSKILGETFYDGLNARYNTNTLSPDENKLLPYIQRALANMAYLEAIPQLAVSITNAGIAVPSGNNSAPASAQKIEEIKDSYRRIGHKALEHLIDYLVKNKSLYADYNSSEAFAEAVECFINSAAEFNAQYSIQNNRWLYWNLKPIMKRLEVDRVKSITGEALYNELKTQIKDDTVSANNKKLLNFIRAGIAHLTIAKASIELGLNMDEYGLTMFTSGTTNAQSVKLRAPATLVNQGLLMNECNAVGEQKLKELSEFLFNNHATYPLYESDTSVYKPGASSDIKNTDGIGFYLL